MEEKEYEITIRSSNPLRVGGGKILDRWRFTSCDDYFDENLYNQLRNTSGVEYFRVKEVRQVRSGRVGEEIERFRRERSLP